MELNEKDKELIAKIDERLKHYKLITDNEQADKEEYVECVRQYSNFTVSKIYKWPYPIDDKGEVRDIYPTELNSLYPWEGIFKPSTKEAYLKQFLPDNEQQAPVEWKVGEWAWLTKGKHSIGLITEIQGNKATADDQNGFIVKELYINEFVKPTKEEIEQHLVKIAEKKYPVGTKVKEVGTDVEYTVTHDGYRYVKSLNDLSFISLEEEWDKGHSNPTIWQNGVWAEPITEQKERFDVWVEENENVFGDHSIIICTKGKEIFTETEAIKISELIRETLKNL